MKLWRFTTTQKIQDDVVFVQILKDQHVITTAEVENDENLLKNIWFLLVNDYSYDKKYYIMKRFYNNWEIDYWKARNEAQKSIEYVKVEKEKQKLLEMY